MRHIFVAAVCATLLGCSSLREGWTKPEATDADRKADLYACERDMLTADAGRAFFKRCMEAKGYRQE